MSVIRLIGCELSPGSRRDLLLDGDRLSDPDDGPKPERIVDIGGRAVVPGLVDHHLHLHATAAAGRSVDVSPAALEAGGGLTAVLRAARRRRPAGWLRATGYDVAAGGPLDRDALDAIDVGPVRIQDRTGILWILDGEALRLVDPADPRDRPEGLETIDGRPTGLLFRLDRWLGERVPRQELDLTALGAQLAATGITAVTDAGAGNTVDELNALARADLPLAVTAMTRDPETPRVDGVALGPVKILLDDADLPTLDDLTARITTAHRVGRTVAVHCVTPVQLVLALSAGVGPRDRIEHASWVPAEVLPLLAERNPTVIVQPGLIARRGDRYLEENDPLDLPDLHRLASLRRAGLRVAASSDAPYGDADPWSTIAAAVERVTDAGMPFGPDEAMEPIDAVALLTGTARDPATPRRLIPGEPADLVVVDGTWSELARRPRVQVTVRGGAPIAGSWPS